MSSPLQNERDAFSALIDGQLGRSSGVMSLEAALFEFRAYQQELAAARSKIQEARESSSRGESTELDVEDLVRDVAHELNADGLRQ
jgi:hypothetical protein